MKKNICVILCLIFGIIGAVSPQAPTSKEEPFVVQIPLKKMIRFNLGLRIDSGSEVLLKNISKEIRSVKGPVYHTLIKQDRMELSLDEGLSLSGLIYFYETWYFGCSFKTLNSFAFKPDRAEEGRPGTGSEIIWYNLEAKEKLAPHFCVGWEQRLGRSKFKFFGDYTFGGEGTLRATNGATGWPQEHVFARSDIGNYRYQLLRAGVLIDENEDVCRLWIYTGWSFHKISFFDSFKSIKTEANMPIFGLRIDLFI
ncbi:MAG: hypothetical protein PHT40_01500 [Patescibacteria group bacterium]|nr:hypothetical protein [Patescibacteria group bacterium]